MNWQIYIKGFVAYLKLERSLSANSIEAYKRDVEKLATFFAEQNSDVNPAKVSAEQLKEFIKQVNEQHMEATSQARTLSGIRAFYKYLLLENIIVDDPTQLIETPRTTRKLPDTLSIEDIDALINAIDLSKPEGERNRAMLETLYSCGLRVSELVGLKISQLFFDTGFVRIVGTLGPYWRNSYKTD